MRQLSGLALLALATLTQAQTPSPSPTASTGRVTRVMRATRAPSAPRIDGRLDDASWTAAAPETEFTQSYPNAGAAPTERTEVRVLFDDEALYVGVHAFDTHPDSIAAQLARRDATGIYSDWIHLVIDSYHDRRNAFRFSVNPRGVQKDVLHSDDRTEDTNWDAVWEVATTVDSTGWSAEYRIPYSQLRFASAAKGIEQVWGIQVQRDIARRSERASWSPWKPTDPGYVSFMGDLTGIVDIPSPRHMEVMPYVSTRLARAPGDVANPFFHSNDVRPSVGADFKYGLPGGLSLTATVNPDFGQVEVDPAVVNLSAFESFFPEKRPFFVEGASIFNLGRVRGGPSYGGGQIFYSRRIGRSPQRFANGDYVDAPDATTILGAGKISGKRGPWTIGILDAVTAEEKANISSSAGIRTSAPVEPATNYLVGRVRRDFNKGMTVVSGGGTSVIRKVDDPMFKDFLRSSAQVGAVDFEHQWSSRTWSFTGAAAASSISGTPTVIANAQRSSARYYQRPDNDYLDVDATRTSLNGSSLALGLNKSGAWSMGVTAKQVSPGFEVNDLGFMGRVDYRNLGFNTGYYNNKPGKTFRDWSYGVGTNHAWNFGGDKVWTSMFSDASATFKNLWYMGGGFEYDPSSLDDRLTRGGPAARRPTGYGGWTYGGTDSRKKVAYNWNVSWFVDEDGGYSRSIYPGINLRPSSSVTVSVAPGLSWGKTPSQYVQSVADSTAGVTFGRRYLLANLQQTTFSVDTRVSWTLSSTLSLQLYAQPFASVGSYTQFKELLAPRTRAYSVYGAAGPSSIAPILNAGGARTGYRIDPDGAGSVAAFNVGNPDFRTQSLRGNAVLRWEYRPGSALFFVWQQQRSNYAPYEGDFQTRRELTEIFTQPTNVFLIKATYWFGR